MVSALLLYVSVRLDKQSFINRHENFNQRKVGKCKKCLHHSSILRTVAETLREIVLQ